MRLRTSFPFLFVAGSAVACNAILDLGRFQAAAGDAGGSGQMDSGSGLPSNLACVIAPNETLDTTPVTLQLQIANTIDTMQTPGQIDGGSDLYYAVYTPQTNVTIQSCHAFDPTCLSPVTSPEVVNEAGVVDLTMAGNFVGFFSGTGPTTVPFTFWPGNWLSGTTTGTYGTSALQYAQEQALNGALDNEVILDAGAGLGELFVVIYDCQDHHLAGATLALNKAGPELAPFYIINGVPNTTASVTDSSGVAGAINVPAGSVRATATDVATSTTIGAIDVYISPGALTLAWIRSRTH